MKQLDTVSAVQQNTRHLLFVGPLFLLLCEVLIISLLSRPHVNFTISSVLYQLLVFMTNPRRTAHGLVDVHPTDFDRLKIVNYIAPYYDASGTLLFSCSTPIAFAPALVCSVSRRLVHGHGHARSNIPR